MGKLVRAGVLVGHGRGAWRIGGSRKNARFGADTAAISVSDTGTVCTEYRYHFGIPYTRIRNHFVPHTGYSSVPTEMNWEVKVLEEKSGPPASGGRNFVSKLVSR